MRRPLQGDEWSGDRRMKKTKTKKSVMQIELVGGVFIVEKFNDGTERRDELDGEVVLKLLLSVLKDAVDRIK